MSSAQQHQESRSTSDCVECESEPSAATTMNPVVTVFLTCLLLLSSQGLPLSRSHKCKCSNGYVKQINLHFIKGEPQILRPSVFCPRTEIIITTRANQEKCLNPQSLLGQLILKNRNMQGRRGAASTTTATTPGSTTGHLTSTTKSTMSITTMQ
ncbi:C-X-C motif chemokine 10-like [Xenentodon cancila]